MPKNRADCAYDSGTTLLPSVERTNQLKIPAQIDVGKLLEKLGPDPGENINSIVGIASELMGGAYAYYCRFNGSNGLLHACCSGKSKTAAHEETAPLKGPLCHEAFLINGNQPIVVEDMLSSPYRDADPAIKKMGFKSFLGCPVTNHDKNLGELGLIDSQRRTYSPADIQTVDLLARALSIEETRLQKELELKRRIQYESMLKKVSTRAIELKDIQVFMDDCLRLIGETLNLGATFIYEYRESAAEIGLISEWYPSDTAPYKIDLKAIPTDSLSWSLGRLMNGETLIFSNKDDMPEGTEKEIARALGTVSFLIVPLYIHSEFIGLMGFEDYHKGRDWSDQDIGILRTAADIISKSMENDRLKSQLKNAVNQTTEKLYRAKVQLEAEIRDHKHTIRRLKTREKDLASKKSRLMDMNNALSVMFRKRNEDIEQIEKQMAHNIRDLIDPALQRLKSSGLKATQSKWLEVLEANLNDIASPLAAKLASGYLNLTPTEIKIASFIKHGNTNKEIARLLSISNRTVEVHRCNIRRKLGIKNRDMNLRTFLLSME